MHKTINIELVQAAIRKSKEGTNLALVASCADGDATTHVLVFQDKDAEAIAKALHAHGVTWRQVEVRLADFHEHRTV